MDHYIDIRLRPDPEFPAHQLLEALYSKLHQALVDMASDAIGVSFPDVSIDGKRLGHRLRLHGSAVPLHGLAGRNWLKGMRDHVVVDDTKPTPATTTHRAVQRIQIKSSAARMRRRLMRRKGLSEAEALARIPDSVSQQSDLPYIMLRSQSTGQLFPLFIQHGPLATAPTSGPFNAYGLSHTSTIPWF